MAGLLMFPAVLAASFVLVAATRSYWANALAIGLPLVAALGLVGASYAAESSALVQSFATEPGGRIILAENTTRAAQAFFPTGSGPGSYVRVYAWFRGSEQLGHSYANHAHNDYLEVFLETGLLGGALVLAFVAWWVVRTGQAWRRSDVDSGWAKASSIVVGIGLAHSLVDYPLRTPALLAVFVLSAVILGSARRDGAALPERSEDLSSRGVAGA
jgi:O-antigen ligase